MCWEKNIFAFHAPPLLTPWLRELEDGSVLRVFWKSVGDFRLVGSEFTLIKALVQISTSSLQYKAPVQALPCLLSLSTFLNAFFPGYLFNLLYQLKPLFKPIADTTTTLLTTQQQHCRHHNNIADNTTATLQTTQQKHCGQHNNNIADNTTKTLQTT